MKKIYILDTSVLVYDPMSFKSFNDNIVIIPITVLEELDKLKKFFDETGKNARTVIRTLDGLLPNNKDIEKGIKLENNILLKIDHNLEEDKSLGTFLYGDNRILSCAIKLNKINRTEKVVLISKDIALRIRAKALGISSEDYIKDRYKSADEIYNSVRELEINDEQTNEFYGNHSIEIDNIFIEQNGLQANDILVLKSSKNDLLGYGRFRSNKKEIFEIKKHKNVFGISPKSSEQNFALDLLLDNSVNLVSLAGPSGTGKTLLSLASGLHSVLEAQDKRYDKLIIMKPIVSVGKDLGTLPGDKEEKLSPFLASYRDNLNFLIKNSSAKMNRNNKDGVDPYLSLMMEKGLIEMEALSYLRGRSLPNSFIIVDECFPGSQKVATSDGKITIGDLYMKQKLGRPLPLIKTYNETTEIFENKKIIHVSQKGERELMMIRCGNRKIECTDNHPFLTLNGWIEAKNLRKGTILKTSEPNTNQLLNVLNDDQFQILLGSFLGDGCIQKIGNNRYRIKEIHGGTQKEYCKWKANMFNSDIKFVEQNGYSQKSAWTFITETFAIDADFPDKKTYCPQWVLDALDPRGLAIWFMDDGSPTKHFNGAQLQTCSFDMDSQKRIAQRLNEMGIECCVATVLNKKKNKYYNFIRLTDSGYIELCDLVAPFIHKNIQYKFNVEDGSYKWNNKYKNYGATVVDDLVYNIRKDIVYDIEVKDNHNFIVCPFNNKSSNNGIIVHNCQNSSLHELKTMITRIGEGSKIVLLGDLKQIDNMQLDSANNALIHAIEKFKGYDICGSVLLTKGERSPLATLASEIL